jgi:hypothetical protein
MLRVAMNYRNFSDFSNMKPADTRAKYWATSRRAEQKPKEKLENWGNWGNWRKNGEIGHP